MEKEKRTLSDNLELALNDTLSNVYMLDAGMEEKASEAKIAAELLKEKNVMDKNRLDYELEIRKLEEQGKLEALKLKLQQEELEDQKFENIVKYVCEAFGGFVSANLLVYLLQEYMTFEQTGVLKSPLKTTFINLMTKFRR